ncbi:MAG TPA: DsbA family oxidoreductase [Polyangiaceae bacterium]|jgi:predicted DsbA family dithiol-disulfide isomerase|nr:DsbA family oxidoreductase [Polyangiaceae bacterium]
MSQLRIDVWSDIACPWCYVGKRRLESALKESPHAAHVEVVWHAFELDPAAPKQRDPSVSHTEYIAKKYGITSEQARRNSDRLVELARQEGLAFDFEHIRSGNTFDAHRLVQLGLERGVQGAVEERFFSAYLEQGALMSDHGTLLRLAVEAGLDEGEVSDVLASDQYAQAVRADEAQAHELGINGVPCFVLDGRFAVSGAQSPRILLSALHQAWAEREPSSAELPEGAMCGPDGC